MPIPTVTPEDFRGKMLASEMRKHAVFNVRREFSGPLLHRLERDAKPPRRFCNGTGTDNLESLGLEHGAPLNHSLIGGATKAIILQERPCTLDRMDTFGERLVHAMQLARITREQLSTKLGISVQAISQVVSGKTKAMNAENTAEAAVVLGCDWYWLATGKGSPTPKEPLGGEDWYTTALWVAKQAGTVKLMPVRFLQIVEIYARNAPSDEQKGSEFVKQLLDMVVTA